MHGVDGQLLVLVDMGVGGCAVSFLFFFSSMLIFGNNLVVSVLLFVGMVIYFRWLREGIYRPIRYWGDTITR